MKAKQRVPVGPGPGNDMDEDLPARDDGAGQRADEQERIVARARPEPQIEREPESGDDKGPALQDAQRARQVGEEKLVGERENQYGADRQEANGIETQRQRGRHRRILYRTRLSTSVA